MATQDIILFDGICNLCNRSVQYVFKHDQSGFFKYTWLQSEKGQQLLKQFNLDKNDMSSFVLIENNNAFTKSTAALKVAKKLNGPGKLLYGFIIVPAFIRDWVYNLIAKNRYKWFGKKEACVIPPDSIKSRFLN